MSHSKSSPEIKHSETGVLLERTAVEKRKRVKEIDFGFGFGFCFASDAQYSGWCPTCLCFLFGRAKRTGWSRHAKAKAITREKQTHCTQCTHTQSEEEEVRVIRSLQLQYCNSNVRETNQRAEVKAKAQFCVGKTTSRWSNCRRENAGVRSLCAPPFLRTLFSDHWTVLTHCCVLRKQLQTALLQV